MIITISLGMLSLFIVMSMLLLVLNNTKYNNKAVRRVTDEYLMESLMDIQGHLLTNYLDNTEINGYCTDDADTIYFRGSDKFFNTTVDEELIDIAQDAMDYIKSTRESGKRFNDVSINTYLVSDGNVSLARMYKDINELVINKDYAQLQRISLKDIYFRTIIKYRAREILVDFKISGLKIYSTYQAGQVALPSGSFLLRKLAFDTSDMKIVAVGMRDIDL